MEGVHAGMEAESNECLASDADLYSSSSSSSSYHPGALKATVIVLTYILTCQTVCLCLCLCVCDRWQWKEKAETSRVACHRDPDCRLGLRVNFLIQTASVTQNILRRHTTISVCWAVTEPVAYIKKIHKLQIG